MNKIVSIAVFGDRGYENYLGAFVRGHLNLFPLEEGWKLRIHTDFVIAAGRYGQMLRRLEEKGLVEVKLMGPAILTKAMLWRMVPIFDDNVDYVFCRDLDAAPMPRDRAVCDVFIKSQATVHTVHDNRAHAGIMGGLCGYHAKSFREATRLHTLDDLYRYAGISDVSWAQHGTDQNVLNRLIDRPGGPTLLEHRFSGWTEGRPGDEKRQAGHWQCPAWSTPTPDAGVSKLSPERAEHADRLANHMGAAGYDHLAARLFWDLYGDKEIAKQVAECET
ncbi:MAG: hypothetical protein UY96_C0003G0017 [Parcubacteria group bacterium GW2011_GWB1_56_8]|nr:MAG: hypothetical protein UY96_C0003G0017 [Parcubacteria group bacterium GW2011_GWB1_56_8]